MEGFLFYGTYPSHGFTIFCDLFPVKSGKFSPLDIYRILFPYKSAIYRNQSAQHQSLFPFRHIFCNRKREQKFQ